MKLLDVFVVGRFQCRLHIQSPPRAVCFDKNLHDITSHVMGVGSVTKRVLIGGATYL